MNKKSKLISGLKSGKDFSIEERKQIIEEYLLSSKTKREVWERHTGQSREDGQLLKWIRKLGYKDKPKVKKQAYARNSPRYFSTSEKIKVIEDYLSSDMSKRAIWEKYTGQEEEHGQLLRWMRKLGYDDNIATRRPNFVSNSVQMKKKKINNNEAESFENLQLKKRIEELEKQLKDAEMKAIAFSTMVDIAEKEFNIPVRKKLNTKPSKK